MEKYIANFELALPLQYTPSEQKSHVFQMRKVVTDPPLLEEHIE
jgi:hypothetical protein